MCRSYTHNFLLQSGLTALHAAVGNSDNTTFFLAKGSNIEAKDNVSSNNYVDNNSAKYAHCFFIFCCLHNISCIHVYTIYRLYLETVRFIYLLLLW